ncbi:MAG: hypothetical protein OXN17_15740 [Candidatus Poribacteria bacterium]|nr:hypothetical protein [Candidatus Poribacteria bacterium]MDE0503932.1 hypothetical protein [Candidatus Poribacteria bacterium]
MRGYNHTQVGYIHVISYSAVILFLGCLNIFTGFVLFTLIPLTVMLILLVLFSSLTVRVGGGVITAKFGVGFIRKRIQLSDVETYAKVRNPWYYGLGIRYTPRGWLYSIFGLSAIELLMKNGKTCRIGTDDLEGFAKALHEALNEAASR